MQVNNKYCIHGLLLFVLILRTNLTYAQKIDFHLASVDPLNISYANEIISDINGDTCSIIKLITSLDSIKFYSNLGVERVVKTDSGYLIWIPNRSIALKMIIPGFPLSEYLIPKSSFKFSIYNLEISVSEIQRIIYTDSIKPVLSFMVTPERARVFLNGKFAGRSPIVMRDPGFYKFTYSIKRKGYETFTTIDSINDKVKSIPVNLNSLFKSRRSFLIINIKSDILYKNLETQYTELDNPPIYGITCGIFGETGFYGAAGFIVKEIYNSGDLSTAKVVKVKVSVGITQQLGRSLFTSLGPGFTVREYNKNSFSSLNNESRGSIDVNSGIIFRIGWYSLLQVDYTISLNKPYMTFGVGLGINLPKNSK